MAIEDVDFTFITMDFKLLLAVIVSLPPCHSLSLPPAPNSATDIGGPQPPPVTWKFGAS